MSLSVKSRGSRTRAPDRAPAPRARVERQARADTLDPRCTRGKAKRGDVPAARELRGWYDQGLGRPEQAAASVSDPTDTTTPYAELSPEERALLRGKMMQRLIDMESALASDALDAAEGGDPPASPSPAD